MKKLILLFVVTALFGQIDYRYHPELKWKRFETEHFAIVFHEGTQESALRIAEIAEEIYGPVTKLYDYRPEKKITFIVKDVDDYSNGGAYFLDDKIEIWTEHLDFDLRGTHNWLKDVITHEFIHMIHIQKSLSSSKTVPFAILQWVGYETERRKDVVRGFPNRLANLPIFFFNIPPWLAEGVAQFQLDGSRFDYRDAQREMILRDRFLNNNTLTLSEMSLFGKSSIGNESVYNQGFSLVQFIVERYGEDVLKKIAKNNATVDALIDFDEAVFVKSTGMSLDSIYALWHKEKSTGYAAATQIIQANKREGKLLESLGEGNFYPTYSSDGKYLAYLSNSENRGLSQNEIILYDIKNNQKTKHTASISSQLRFLPNKHQLIYSRNNELNNWGSSYNDLYLYDIETKKEMRLTFGMRARNASVSASGKVVFVSTYDGSTNLLEFELADKKEEIELDYINHTIKTGDKQWLRGKNLRFVTKKSDFTQYFHPIFKDEQTIITDKSLGYNRYLVELDIETASETVLKQGKTVDYRDPLLVNNELYFASNKTGIFNIYRSSGAVDIAVTNVLAGAFMPAVHGSELSFSLYQNAGFKISQLEMENIGEEKLLYQLKADPFPLEDREIKYSLNRDSLKFIRQKYQFNSFYAIPRILLDDKRPKFGFAFLANELLDKSSLYFSAVYNSIGERDIYAGIEVRNFSVFGKDPIFFFDVFNQTVKIDDRLKYKFDEGGQFVDADRPVQFTLWQYELGWKLKLWNSIDWKFNVIWSSYDANLNAAYSNTIYDNGREVNLLFPFLRYTYHKGQSFEQKILIEEKDNSFIGEIVPRSAYRSMITVSKNDYEFLNDFAFNTTGISEIYTPYNYVSIQFSGAVSFPNLWKKSGWTFELKAASNLEKVDEFYDHYLGGWIGLKGYPYFSLHGQHSAHASLYLNQLIIEDASLDIGVFNVKNIAISAFGQWGDAWTDAKFDYKSNAGLQLKADSYGPMKMFFEAVLPMNEIRGTERDAEGAEIPVIYPKEWRFYFGLMYDFELKDFL